MAKKQGTYRRTSSTIAHINPWYRIRRDGVVLPSGKRGEYFVLEKPDAVITIPVDARGCIGLITLFRYPIGSVSIECPAGCNEEKETLLTTAKRELLEETGLKAKRWVLAGRIWIANGFAKHRCHVYVATNLSSGVAIGAEEEGIENLKFVAPEQLRIMIARGRITDDLTLSALMVASASGHININRTGD